MEGALSHTGAASLSCSPYRRLPGAPPGSNFCAILQACAPNATTRSMFIIPHGAPEGYEWFVALVVLVGLYFAVRSFMRARR